MSSPAPSRPSSCPSEFWNGILENLESDKENIPCSNELNERNFSAKIQESFPFDLEDSKGQVNDEILEDEGQNEEEKEHLENEKEGIVTETEETGKAPEGFQNEELVSLEVIDINDKGESLRTCKKLLPILKKYPENGNLVVISQEILNGNFEIQENIFNQEQVDNNFNDNEAQGNLTIENERESGDGVVQNTSSRKRKRNMSEWKQNVRKSKRQRGEEYVNTKGAIRPQRSVKKGCEAEKCPFVCVTKITPEERQIIHDKFWTLNDEKKNHFYSKHVKRNQCARKRTESDVSRKKYSYSYHFFVRGVRIKVCQEFFLQILDINKNRIYHFFKKVQDNSTNVPRSPLTGKHTKKVISEEKRNGARRHIESFPTVDSHYCRKESTRKYLETGLNLQKMYDLYKSTTADPVKYHLYRSLFNSEYNLSFFKPKKDMCDKCQAFRVLSHPTDEQLSAKDDHVRRKVMVANEKQRDKTDSSVSDEMGILSFDLENTFALPKSNISNFYYKSKLSVYNLTAHLDKTKVVYNAVWHELTCGRGAVHIACALVKILKKVMIDNPNLKKNILWSDSCVPQNKNSIMTFALQYFLMSPHAKDLEVIEQKFGEPGHSSVQEVDAAHSCIERYLKNLDIWSPLALIRLMLKIPPTWKLKFTIIQMIPNDYLNYQISSGSYSYNQIPYTKIKHLVYEKASIFNIKFRNHFEEPFHEIKLGYIKSTRSQDIISFPQTVPHVNLTPTISELKKKHLSEMLPYMPEDERHFYNILNISAPSKVPGKKKNETNNVATKSTAKKNVKKNNVIGKDAKNTEETTSDKRKILDTSKRNQKEGEHTSQENKNATGRVKSHSKICTRGRKTNTLKKKNAGEGSSKTDTDENGIIMPRNKPNTRNNTNKLTNKSIKK